MERTHRHVVLPAVLALVAGVGLTACAEDDVRPGDAITASPAPTEASEPDETSTESADPAPTGPPVVVDTVATGLEAPWGIAFLPDDSALVTERDSGRVLAVAPGEEPREVAVIDETDASGSEAGLLGIAVSPDFADDGLVYLYVTTSEDNRVIRAPYDGERLGETDVVLAGIPAANTHDGGRIMFGPDGYLYITTGDAQEPGLAQDRSSLAGKILRVDGDGTPAPDNPDPDSPVWSWGHRNVQGLAFDDDDNLWATEFGSQVFDELNLIEPGNNYGWPEVEGEGGGADFTDPQVVWRVDEASPSGLAYAAGHVWMAALRGQRLWRITVADGRASAPQDFLAGEYGRIRTVATAPDGNLWVTTSNRDGRGDPAAEDDRILLVSPTG